MRQQEYDRFARRYLQELKQSASIDYRGSWSDAARASGLDFTSRDAPAGPPLAVTMGDPAGIGPDITIRAWRIRLTSSLPVFFVAGDPAVFIERAHLLAG